MADPRSNGHGKGKPQNLGPLIIAGGIVLAGVIVAFAVLATRSQPDEPTVVAASPQFVPPAGPVDSVSSPDGTIVSPAAAGAQESLTTVSSTAQTIHAETGSYSDATSFELATRLPGYTYLPASEPSSSPTEISFFADGNIFAAAALDADGTCYWVKDDRTTSKTTYGSGPICTGNSALAATAESW